MYLADQGPLAHLPSEIAALSSSYEETSTILLTKERAYILVSVFSDVGRHSGTDSDIGLGYTVRIHKMLPGADSKSHIKRSCKNFFE